ncbi:MAG: hypothetical protein JWR72_3926 [Flavisolibacter sp.]|nr:hypothetical protein [Flavisolibacter sp.]
MEKTKKYLLTTRPLAKAVVEEAATKNIVIEELSFIETNAVVDPLLTEKIQGLSTKKLTVVFTSMNAVEAVANQIKVAVDWRIYCMGNTTKKLIQEKLPSAQITGTADNAESLAQEILDDEIENAVFFCGNIRRDELPQKLRSKGVKIEEVIVYETTEIQNLLTRQYEGVLFFSPSAVHSFFKLNKLPQQTRLFAIGKTTKETIRKYADNKIIIAQTADKNELAKQAVAYVAKA